MSVSIKYKGTEIASASTEVTKTIKTAGKYCEADILVENTPDGGDAPVINPLSVTANGTYTAPSGVDGYSPVTVNVPQGVFPSGSVTLTAEDTYDVTDKASAVVDFSATRADLAEAVTAKGVDTLPTASFDTIATNIGLIEGGGGGGDIITPWYTVKTAEVTIGANSVNNPQTAVAYFEGIFGEGNVVAVFLKDQKTTYGADELVVIPQALSHTASNVTGQTTQLYRMRNNTATAFQGTSGYSCYLYEGAKYAVIYYDVKP